MRVRLLYFGALTEAFGVREETLDLSGVTVAELVSVLRQRPSNRVSEDLWARLAVAVNREYVMRDAILREGDEVALLPPVSGGCGSRPCA